MEKVNKYLGCTILMFIVFWIGRSFYKNNQFKKDYKITTGRVNRITSPGWKSNGDYSLLYDYTVNGVRYTSSHNYKLCKGLSKDKIARLVINNFFPVAYSTNDNNQSIIIITHEDAAMFNYTITDSLLVYDSLLTCK